MEKQTNCANCVIFVFLAVFCTSNIAVFTACTGDEGPTGEKPFVPGPTNPFITDRFTADPAAFFDNDGTVYIVCGEDTLPPDAQPSEYYRISRWHIYSTRDMKTFKYENVLMRSEDFSYGQVNSAWASQAIRGLDGRYYFYGTVQSSQGQVISVAVADDPRGPYEQVGRTPLVTRNMVSTDLRKSHENIDPTVFIDDDGTAYLAWGQINPCITKLKDTMTEIERPIRFLFPEDGSWKSEDEYREGPFLYKRKGKYYMFYASMKVDSQRRDIAETISYAMADSLEGPWTDGVRITDCAPAIDEENSFTIHPAVLDFKEQTYLFYHNAMLKLDVDGVEWRGATGRRSLCVDYLYFNDDGTIQFVDVRNPAGLSAPPKGK